MSIDRALAKEGLQLVGDQLPKEQRSQKVFKRAIAALRAAEAESRDQLDIANAMARDAMEQVSRLQARVFELESKLAKQEVSTRLDGTELTKGDKQFVLEALPSS